jgi:hypothetical protein
MSCTTRKTYHESVALAQMALKNGTTKTEPLNAQQQPKQNPESHSVILVTAGYDNTIRFWEALSGICSRTIQHPNSVSK